METTLGGVEKREERDGGGGEGGRNALGLFLMKSSRTLAERKEV